MSDRTRKARTGTSRGESGPARVYQMLVPPGWVRLDARDSTASVEQLVADLVPRRRGGPAKAHMQRLLPVLRDMLADARESGVLDLYFPVAEGEESIQPVSFAVAEFDLSSGGDPIDALVSLAGSDPTARAVEIVGSVAVRTEVRQAAEKSVHAVLDRAGESADGLDEDALAQVMTRQVRYVVGVPGDSERWVTVVFTAQVPSDPAAAEVGDAFVELFDALMTTFSWR